MNTEQDDKTKAVYGRLREIFDAPVPEGEGHDDLPEMPTMGDEPDIVHVTTVVKVGTK